MKSNDQHLSKVGQQVLFERRCKKQGLGSQVTSLNEYLNKALGIQSQYLFHSIIIAALRTGLDMNSILNNKYISRTWVQRNTLHLINDEDYLLLANIFRIKKPWCEKYLNEKAINPSEVIEFIKNELADGKMDGRKLSETIKRNFSEGVNDWSCSLILASTLQIITSKLENLTTVFSLTDSVVENVYDVDTAINELFKRYLYGYGPASLKDFSHWSGIKESELKILEKMNDIDELVFGNKLYYDVKIPSELDENIDFPVILGKFDPLLVSYADKEWILRGIPKTEIWLKGGQIEAVVISTEGIIAKWRYKIKNKSIFIINLIFLRETNNEMIKKVISKFERLKIQLMAKEVIFEIENKYVNAID